MTNLSEIISWWFQRENGSELIHFNSLYYKINLVIILKKRSGWFRYKENQSPKWKISATWQISNITTLMYQITNNLWPYSHHIKISENIKSASKLYGFYMVGILVINWFNWKEFTITTKNYFIWHYSYFLYFQGL